MDSLDPNHINVIKEAVKDAVTTTVNGKIDIISKKLDDHMEKVQPILEAYQTATGAKRFITQVAIVIGSLGAIGIGISQIIGWFNPKA